MCGWVHTRAGPTVHGWTGLTYLAGFDHPVCPPQRHHSPPAAHAAAPLSQSNHRVAHRGGWPGVAVSEGPGGGAGSRARGPPGRRTHPHSPLYVCWAAIIWSQCPPHAITGHWANLRNASRRACEGQTPRVCPLSPAIVASIWAGAEPSCPGTSGHPTAHDGHLTASWHID